MAYAAAQVSLRNRVNRDPGLSRRISVATFETRLGRSCGCSCGYGGGCGRRGGGGCSCRGGCSCNCGGGRRLLLGGRGVGRIDDSCAVAHALGRRWGLGGISGNPRPLLYQCSEQRREGDGHNNCPYEHHRGQCGCQGIQCQRGVARLGTPEKEVGGHGTRHEAHRKHPPRQIVHALTSFLRTPLFLGAASLKVLLRPFFVRYLAPAGCPHLGTLIKGRCKSATPE